MKAPLLLLSLVSHTLAGDILVISPANQSASAIIESLETGEGLKNPEPTSAQEGQIENHTFKNVKPGKYRVSYMSTGNPLGFDETLMETIITVGESNTVTVYLFRPDHDAQLNLPKDVEDFLRLHRDNLMELTAVYDGTKTKFVQAIGGASFICYLRNDCEYQLKVWNHSYQEFPEDPKKRTVIFERKFRTVARELDPFAPGGVPEAPKD